MAGIDRGFSCVALSLSEWGEILEAAEEQPEASREEWRQLEIVARSLRLDGEPAFHDAASMASLLDRHELAEVTRAVSRALAVVCPARPFFDEAAWIDALAEGAMAPANQRRAFALAMSFDSGMSHHVPRLDRFFGVSPDDTTDGQWLAYMAARKAFRL